MIFALTVKIGHALILISVVYLAILIPAFALASGVGVFSIEVSPRSQNMTAGGSTTFTVNIYGVGYMGAPLRNVSLGVSGVPSGVTVIFDSNPVIITNEEGKTTFTVKIVNEMPTSSFTFRIYGLAVDARGGQMPTERDVTINVISPDGRHITVQPSVTRNVTITSTIISTSTVTATSTTTAQAQTSTATITNTVSSMTSVIVKETSTVTSGIRESDAWSYSPIGAGIALAGLFIAVAIFRRK